jgi:cytochrome c oxidase subunit 1
MGGFMNFLVPIITFAPDMIFPRLNNLSFRLLLLSIMFLVLKIFTEEGVAAG